MVVPVYVVRPIVLVIVERVIVYGVDNVVDTTIICPLCFSRIVAFQVSLVCSFVTRVVYGRFIILQKCDAVFSVIVDHVGSL